MGSGNGEFIQRVDRHVKSSVLDAVDIKSIDHKYNTNHGNMININRKEINSFLKDLNSNSYEYVTCLHVIEHLTDYQRVISELKRITRKGIIIACPLEKEHKWGFNYHINFFTEYGLETLLKDPKWIIVKNNTSLGDNLIILEYCQK